MLPKDVNTQSDSLLAKQTKSSLGFGSLTRAGADVGIVRGSAE